MCESTQDVERKPRKVLQRHLDSGSAPCSRKYNGVEGPNQPPTLRRKVLREGERRRERGREGGRGERERASERRARAEREREREREREKADKQDSLLEKTKRTSKRLAARPPNRVQLQMSLQQHNGES